MERRRSDGITVRVQALEHRIIRVQAGGYDGYRESLLERYGIVRRIPTAPDAVESESCVECADGVSVTPTDDGFEVVRDGEELVRTLPGTLPATAPTFRI